MFFQGITVAIKGVSGGAFTEEQLSAFKSRYVNAVEPQWLIVFNVSDTAESGGGLPEVGIQEYF